MQNCNGLDFRKQWVIDLIERKIKRRQNTIKGFKKRQVNIKQLRSIEPMYVQIRLLKKLKKQIEAM